MTTKYFPRREQKVFGNGRIDSWVTFKTKNGVNPDVLEAQGVVSVARTAEGVFEIVLPESTKSPLYQVTYGLEYDPGDYVDPLNLVVSSNSPSTRKVVVTLCTYVVDGQGSVLLGGVDAPDTVIHVHVSMRIV